MKQKTHSWAIDFVMNSKNEGAWAVSGDFKDASKIFDNKEGSLVSRSVEEGVV